MPRYFDKLAEQQGFDLTEIKKARDLKIKTYGNTFPTLQEKREYKNTMLEQGYNADHLFMPSHKKQLSHFLAFDRDGVADLDHYKKELQNYLTWQNNTFFDTFPIEKKKTSPIVLKYKPMTMYDYGLKLYNYKRSV